MELGTALFAMFIIYLALKHKAIRYLLLGGTALWIVGCILLIVVAQVDRTLDASAFNKIEIRDGCCAHAGGVNPCETSTDKAGDHPFCHDGHVSICVWAQDYYDLPANTQQELGQCGATESRFGQINQPDGIPVWDSLTNDKPKKISNRHD